MMTINTDTKVERDFKKIITANYNGDITKALVRFIEYERMKDLSWEEKFQNQLTKLRRNLNKVG